jgi:TM2 domain-containing membrane protein YozV
MRKNPGVAAVMSFLFCGLGQIYNDEIGKGIFLFFLEGFQIFLIRQTLLVVPTAIGLWIYGIVNAHGTAEAINSKIDELEYQRNKEQEPTSASTSNSIPAGGFKRKIRGKINFKNFDPID